MNQVGGTHYENMRIEPITLMRENFTDAEFEGFLKGNALKYLMRYQAKNGVEDLKKCSTYISELIKFLEV